MELKIPYFRGVFSINKLPKKKIRANECAVVNLDRSESNGSHWVCYKKTRDKIKDKILCGTTIVLEI